MLSRWRPLKTIPTAAPVAVPAGPEVAGRDAELLLRIGRGDRNGALRELYRRYERRLFGLGVKLLGDPGLAEELVQETFLRLWRVGDRFDASRGPASAFIFAIARRLAVDLWRRPSSRPLAAIPPGSVQADDELDRLLVGLGVRDALDSLSPEHREVLELSYRGDQTQTEIAERLGLPLGTVKSRTYHALRAFRRAAQQRGIDG